MKQNESGDLSEMLDKKCSERADHSTKERIEKLEVTVFRFLGFLLGALLTHILIHLG